VPERRLCLLT